MRQWIEIVGNTLREDFRVYTRDDRANWLTHGVNEIMDDVDGEKTILKQGPNGYYSVNALTVYPDIYYEDRRSEFYIEIHDGTAIIHETYTGEAIPVLRFLLSRWPAYGAIEIRDWGMTFANAAKNERPRLGDQTIWFHGTTTQHLPDILRLGLLPRDTAQRNYRGLNGSEQGLVYLGSNADMAKGHAINAASHFGGAPIVLQIDLAGLEDRIVNDKDVRATSLGGSYDRGDDVTTQRIRRTPGAASYLAIGTIAFKGRIPPNRIKVIWQGKAQKGRLNTKADMYAFIDQLAGLAKQLDHERLSIFFHIIGLQISGWRPQPYYADGYYAEPEKTLNSVFSGKSQPKQFARWVRGMKVRSSKLRLRGMRGLGSPQEAEIMRLIDAKAAELGQRLVNEAANNHPIILYHVSPSDERESIMKDGLLRRKSWTHQAAIEREDGLTSDDNPWGGIFFASKPSYQKGCDLWQVDVSGLSIEPDVVDPEDPEDTWWVTYDEDVAPDRLKFIHAGKLTEAVPLSPVSEGSAWHGSRRRFKTFNIQKINTGEKNQAYGWGLYFASQRAVGEYYQRVLANPSYRDHPIPRSDKRLLTAVRALLRASGDKEDARSIAPEVADLIDTIAYADIGSRGGVLYEVELPDDSQFLHWDVPFKGQSAHVKRALRQLVPKYGRHMRSVIQDNDTGQVIYSHMGNFNRNERRVPVDDVRRVTSLDLRDAGVAGIKYFDAGTRSRPEDGTFNYVVFDHDLIKIIDRR